MNPILIEVQAERDRQIAKGYDAAHDDGAKCGELAEVAGLVMLRLHDHETTSHVSDNVADYILNKWAGFRRRQIIIALAMGLAEVERIDRMEKA